MRTRIIAVAIAAVLAVVGAVVLVVAVRSAQTQGQAGAQLQSVLVVTSEIPAGTPADRLGDAVSSERIPTAYVVDGALTDLADVAGLVATTSLEPGEQLLASRFATTNELASTGLHVAVPDGMQEVSVAVDLQRVAGGSVGPGGRVGLFASFGDTAGSSTRLLLDQVLVTSITSTVNTTDTTSPEAQGLVLVTLAVTADQAQEVVYAAEFGKIWMSAQNDASTPATSGPVTSAAVN